jgi:hypothetical protein
MNEIRKSVFSRLCSVSRATIGELCEKGETLEASTSGKIDLDNPKNLAYLMKHNPAEAARIASGGGVAFSEGGSASKPVATGSRKQSKKPATKAGKESRTDPTIGAMNRKQEASSDGEESDSKLDLAIKSGALTESEINEIVRKSLYDSQKAKAEAALKAVALDKEHGSLGELKMFDSFITELWQSIQRNMLDVINKQAALVCKRLGTVGKELEVMDVLEEDMKKRMDNVAMEVQTILQGKLSRKVTEVAVE